ncbi:hypothetical protein PIB30_001588 [Stylosanthes scabra]|uniref:Uncharacterized protein n=1 Tax=Stylosanthes scabra TaxID=79078 RepID=A0ABU6S321_9FABA|nr:hypothetical protein [Stylosanthes scabra]
MADYNGAGGRDTRGERSRRSCGERSNNAGSSDAGGVGYQRLGRRRWKAEAIGDGGRLLGDGDWQRLDGGRLDGDWPRQAEARDGDWRKLATGTGVAEAGDVRDKPIFGDGRRQRNRRTGLGVAGGGDWVRLWVTGSRLVRQSSHSQRRLRLVRRAD